MCVCVCVFVCVCVHMCVWVRVVCACSPREREEAEGDSERGNGLKCCWCWLPTPRTPVYRCPLSLVSHTLTHSLSLPPPLLLSPSLPLSLCGGAFSVASLTHTFTSYTGCHRRPIYGVPSGRERGAAESAHTGRLPLTCVLTRGLCLSPYLPSPPRSHYRTHLDFEVNAPGDKRALQPTVCVRALIGVRAYA